MTDKLNGNVSETVRYITSRAAEPRRRKRAAMFPFDLRLLLAIIG